MMSKQAYRRRSELALATRFGDPQKVAVARRKYRAARAEDIVRGLIAESPPLTAAQIDRLTGILTAARRAGQLTDG
jgi:hypothetical protein